MQQAFNNQLQMKEAELRLIYEGSDLISSAVDIEEAMQNCIDLICEVLDWPVGHVYVLSECKTLMKPANTWYLQNPRKMKAFQLATQSMTVKRGEGFPGQVWAVEKPVWVEDISQASFFQRREFTNTPSIRGALGFPIVVNNEVIAIIECFTYSLAAENAEMLALFEKVGKQLGYVLSQKRPQNNKDVMAQYDAVTGLPNRTFFNEILQNTLMRASRLKNHVALMFIDLDDFKKINDQYGHVVGDKLLFDTANRIKAIVRSMDYVARQGGDEFVVILDALKSPRVAGKLAARLIESMQMPFMIDGYEIHIGLSIGIGMYPNAGLTADALLRSADAAMYRAKARGKNTYQFYTDTLSRDNLRCLAIENNLRQAILHDEFHLVYQPQVHIDSGALIGVEAFLRWHSQYLGLVSPEEFIPIAESCGLVHEIGDWVISNALKQLSIWMQTNATQDLAVHVNCAVTQLRKKSFIECIQTTLERYNLKGRQLHLELTETKLMESVADIREPLKQLNGLGVQMVIDDFGRGYSSLHHLKQLPISALKISQSLIGGILGDANDEMIVKAIIELGNTLNLNVIAKGVETQAQQACLRSLGCSLAQGAYYKRALQAQEIEGLLKQKI